MKSFEREMREFLKDKDISFADHGDAFKSPDFLITGKGGESVWVEVKEKRQKYAADKWPFGDLAEHNAFILDELTARKVFLYGPKSCIFIRDNTTGLFYFADPLALFLMSRTRCTRNHGGVQKGKWVVNLKNFLGSDKLYDLFVFMRDYMTELEGLTNRDVWPYRPDFVDEVIVEAGTPRTNAQKEYDVQATR